MLGHPAALANVAVSQPSAQPPATATPRWLGRIAEFLEDRRVPISNLVFGGMIIEDIVNRVVPNDIFDYRNPAAMIGLVCVLVGLGIRSWAAGFLVKYTELTVTGPYAQVRNPLYLGSFLMVAGFCLLINDRENIVVLPIVLLVLYWPKVRSEERWLAVRFPETWPVYSARTPRIIPRLLAWPQVAGWRLAQWMKSREYQAVLATAAALVGLKLLRNWYLSA